MGGTTTRRRGMEEAIAYLDAMSPDDWEDDEERRRRDGDDDEYGGSSSRPPPPDVRLGRSRTDDTPASHHGKYTEEEVEHYLDMRGEMMMEEGGGGKGGLGGTATTATTRERDGDGAAVDVNSGAGGDGADRRLSDSLRRISIDDGMITAEEREGRSMIEEDHDSSSSSEEEEEEDRHPWKSINPILRLRGPVASGYGRGGKQLGVPTANVSLRRRVVVYIILCFFVYYLELFSHPPPPPRWYPCMFILLCRYIAQKQPTTQQK